jgi:hypothetical protein
MSRRFTRVIMARAVKWWVSGVIRVGFAVRMVTVSLHGSISSLGSEDGLERLMSNRVCQKHKYKTGAEGEAIEFGNDSLTRSSSPLRSESTMRVGVGTAAVTSDGVAKMLAR